MIEGGGGSWRFGSQAHSLVFGPLASETHIVQRNTSAEQGDIYTTCSRRYVCASHLLLHLLRFL